MGMYAMSNVFSNYEFNQNDIDLSRLYYNAYDFNLYDNYNITYNWVHIQTYMTWIGCSTEIIEQAFLRAIISLQIQIRLLLVEWQKLI